MIAAAGEFCKLASASPGQLVVLGVLAHMTSIWLVPVLLAVGLVNVGFFHLLKRPTPLGRQVMDQIEGFKMYLSATERGCVGIGARPELTGELFEEYLPYAAALGVQSAWAEQFQDVLDRAAAGEGGWQPAWYHGAALGALGAAGFASSFSGSFSSALSSASRVPGSSSGSGGGGSSGGGSGGGGGGGW